MLDGYDRLEIRDPSRRCRAHARRRRLARLYQVRLQPRIKRAEPARISLGQPAADATFDGVILPRRTDRGLLGFGRPALLHPGRGYPGSRRLRRYAGAADNACSFVCAADRVLEFQPGADRQVARCSLAASVEVQDIPCAGGRRDRDHRRQSDQLHARRGTGFRRVEIPAGSVVHLTGMPRRLERFLLPMMAAPLAGVRHGAAVDCGSVAVSKRTGTWTR